MKTSKLLSFPYMLQLFLFSAAHSYGQNNETIILPCQSFNTGSVYLYKEIIEKKETLFEEVTVVSNDNNIIEIKNKSTKLTDITPTITYLYYKEENNTCYFQGNNIKANDEIIISTSFLPALPVCGVTPRELEYTIISTQNGPLASSQNFEMKKTLTLMGSELITTPAGTFYCTVILEKTKADGDSSHVEKSKTLYYAEDVGIVRAITKSENFSARELIRYTP